ncbi:MULTISPECIES: DUF3007 family protein [unclassified Prochlorococcus]|uniref:DUF3007 family protein n=2 Tax=unclassified Prochlorococcus TaxID=2627481 RepID=UPI00267B8CD3
MVKERFKHMTRAKVIQLGFLVLILGGLAYSVFSFAGLDSISAGIAAQSLLVVVVVGWTGSYLLRVVSGNMTFMQQRRRYQQAYENLSTAELETRFDALPDAEKVSLLKDIEDEKPKQQAPSDQ